MTHPTAPIDLASLALDSFRDRPVAVLGLARSGLALTRFLVDQGARVTVYDARSAAGLADSIAELGDRKPVLRLGPEVDPGTVLEDQALVCTSPSVNSRYPTTEPRLRGALAALEAAGRIPVVSEVDLFLRLCPARTIGITGTKGKTTTSALCAAVLSAGAAPVILGGNIGLPLVERLPSLTPGHRVVLELSELQLPTLSRGTDVAVYTHVTSDHLDRHGTLDAYRLVKRRLVELLRQGGVFVRNDDDPVVHSYSAPAGRSTVGYAKGVPGSGSVGVSDGWIVARDVHATATRSGGGATDADGGTVASAAAGATATAAAGATDSVGGAHVRVMPVAEIPLPGDHSISNVLAAVAVGLLHGVRPEAIREAVLAFPGVAHRLELVGIIDGVRYINDSQGTQPDAVIAAVNSFPQPLVLIAGGRSKGVPIDELAAGVANRVTAAVLIGETADELAAAFDDAGLRHIERAATLEAAVVTATAIARQSEQATVLLSPAAASFDMFADYEARGAAFKAAVRAIAASGR